MKRLRIDRIDLHLKNVSAAVAEDTARRLGPALAEALASGAAADRARPTRDGERLTLETATDARGIAAGIAGRIAAKARNRD